MITIGLGEYAITDACEESIITYALGSCVALVLHCPVTGCTGMAHIVLPESNAKHHIQEKKEAYFASEIVPKMLDYFINRPSCNVEKLRVLIVGGSECISENDMFKIGPKNVAKVKSFLDAYQLRYNETDTLGCCSRTVEISIGTGMVKIKRQPMKL